jgi:hypothetical protein
MNHWSARGIFSISILESTDRHSKLNTEVTHKHQNAKTPIRLVSTHPSREGVTAPVAQCKPLTVAGSAIPINAEPSDGMLLDYWRA